MNALILSAAALLLIPSPQAAEAQVADLPGTANVTGTIVTKAGIGGEPGVGVRVTLMAVRRNAEALLEPDTENLKACEPAGPSGKREPYSFCTVVTDKNGRFSFEGVRPGLYALTPDKEAEASGKLAPFGKRAICQLRADMTHDIGQVEIEK